MKFNRLIPEIAVSDLGKSVNFYTKILGFKKEYSRENFVFLSFQGSQLMIEFKNDNWKTGDLEYPFGRGINFQFEVDDVLEILKKVKKAKHPIFRQLIKKYYLVKGKKIYVKEFLIQDL